jgi:chorismate mutase
MLLFIHLFEENLVGEFSPQFEPLLRRLCIMEAVAAIKFVTEKPINDPAREKIVLSVLEHKCIEHGFDDEKTAFFQEYFKENIIIAKLIQEAFISVRQHTPKNEVLEYATNSIAKITGKEVNKSNLLEIVRLYIDELTDQVILTLNVPSDITNYTVLEQLLINCFGNIIKEELSASIRNLKRITTSYNDMLEHQSVLLTTTAGSEAAEIHSGLTLTDELLILSADTISRAGKSSFINNSVFFPTVSNDESIIGPSDKIMENTKVCYLK